MVGEKVCVKKSVSAERQSTRKLLSPDADFFIFNWRVGGAKSQSGNPLRMPTLITRGRSENLV